MLSYDTDHLAADAIDRWRKGMPTTTVSLTVERTWRRPADSRQLTVDYHCSGSPEDPRVVATVDGASFSLDDPLKLEPVEIPKPWGREIWFSGIEDRGESQVIGDGGSLPLSCYLALAPDRICRRHPVVLLKILDPLPTPVAGELYLEVHAEKREVYVVTHVDREAWPDGKGRIRFGVDQAMRQRIGCDADFRAAFLEAVADYETARMRVDGTPSPTGEDLARERAARDAALAFTATRELAVGDVVSVPTWIPHSLQHGVTVVEFQTPTYERFIISAAQKVLTQNSWDSRTAIENMLLDTPVPERFEAVAPGVDRIARFDDFGVWRADIGSEGTLNLPTDAPFALATCLSGELVLQGPTRTLSLHPGEAAFIPAGAVGRRVIFRKAGIGLFAAPGL